MGYLQLHPCITCGESDPIVLEFNHTHPSTKSANISDLVRLGCSLTRLFDEIEKCEVMCADCHQGFTSVGRPKHYRRAETQAQASGAPVFRAAANARNHALVLQFLAQAACVDRGEQDWLTLQFDHTYGKLDHIAWLVGSGCSPVRLHGELAKCQVRCANCHRHRTAHVGNWFRARGRGPGADAASTN